jgi:hypothetical protein
MTCVMYARVCRLAVLQYSNQNGSHRLRQRHCNVRFCCTEQNAATFAQREEGTRRHISTPKMVTTRRGAQHFLINSERFLDGQTDRPTRSPDFSLSYSKWTGLILMKVFVRAGSPLGCRRAHAPQPSPLQNHSHKLVAVITTFVEYLSDKL